jgi:hypothetical protein
MTFSFRMLKHVSLAALPLAALGCTESTTSKDVTEATQEVQEQESELADARHEAMKPTIDDDDDDAVVVDANGNAVVDPDEAEDIREEEQDVAEARTDLNQTQQEFAATQARDAFALEAQKLIDEANRQIDALKTRHTSEEGAAAEATQAQIDDLEGRRDRLDQAIDDMNGAELMQWSEHKSHVQSAMNELQEKLNDIP